MSTEAAVAESTATPRLIALFAVACGLIVANIYYAQPLAGPIAEALGISAGATGTIVTLTQIGYGLGLLFVVPLGDLLETRRLVVAAVAGRWPLLSAWPCPRSHSSTLLRKRNRSESCVLTLRVAASALPTPP